MNSMDRIEIKSKAKEMIKDNKWYIWKPVIIIALITIAAAIISGILDSSLKAGGKLTLIFDTLVELFAIAASVGYIYYILQFVRGKKLEWKEVFSFAKDNWAVSIVVCFLAAFIITIGSALLIIPGIIAGIGLTFTAYVVADNPEISFTDAISKSWELTKGYKWFIFVFILSFIGWVLLASFTLGLLFIWLVPYITIAEALLYERLKAIKK